MGSHVQAQKLSLNHLKIWIVANLPEGQVADTATVLLGALAFDKQRQDGVRSTLLFGFGRFSDLAIWGLAELRIVGL